MFVLMVVFKVTQLIALMIGFLVVLFLLWDDIMGVHKVILLCDLLLLMKFLGLLIIISVARGRGIEDLLFT